MKLAVQGRSIFGPFATLRVQAKPQQKTRIAFITSTKVFKRSVDRNRAKRRMREVLRGLLPELSEGLFLLFVLKPESKDAPYPALIEEVKRLVSKVPEALTKPPKPSSRGVKYTATRNQPKNP